MAEFSAIDTPSTIAGSSHRLTCGQIIRLPARVPHAVEAVDRFKMLLVMLKA